jgi:hypothetical protein
MPRDRPPASRAFVFQLPLLLLSIKSSIHACVDELPRTTSLLMPYPFRSPEILSPS